ncbi:hypothetical protein J5N97_029024 [Dioscorea zingiberensis]|uniref:BHLH domain-containing protein n=1 Tax=Dioscorea zingiberensis TaxID=325984 RepID=A0A9D5H5I1_9LILI|nr:hypothetical protein J5N97_029024 [Dioscorea zingiberensis]
MELDPAAEYLIDDAGMALDGELRRAIESLCGVPPTSGVEMEDAYIGAGALQQMDSMNGVEMGIMFGGSCSLEQTNSRNVGLAYQDAYTLEHSNSGTSMNMGVVYEQAPSLEHSSTMNSMNAGLIHGDDGSLEEHNTRKRAMDEECSRPKSKACREKMRRDKLNDRFLELSSVLDPGRPPKSDKGSILSDVSRVLEQLKAEVQELKTSNEKLQETIKDLKTEKSELRDEKTKLKAEKERLEQQVKAMSMQPVGYMPHPVNLFFFSTKSNFTSFFFGFSYAIAKDMMSVLPTLPRNLALQVPESSLKTKSNKLLYSGCSGIEFLSGGALSAQRDHFANSHRSIRGSRFIFLRAFTGDADPDNTEDDNQDEEPSKGEEVGGGLSREDLERIVGRDDSSFSGVDLATLIRKKYGRSYDVQLIKKEFMGRNLLAMNVMWKYMEQRSFPLTEEEYILRLDGVANTLRCWGAVSHIRNSLEKLKERPRIGKAVSIFIDMDETGARSNEWIYK